MPFFLCFPFPVSDPFPKRDRKESDLLLVGTVLTSINGLSLMEFSMLSVFKMKLELSGCCLPPH